MKTLKKAVAQYKKDTKISEGEWRRMCTFNKNNFNKERLLVQIIISRYGMPDDCADLNEISIAKKLSREVHKINKHKSQIYK